jgi:hypothetical protein
MNHPAPRGAYETLGAYKRLTAVSSSGTANNIVRVADITAHQTGETVILDVYDSINLSTLLYSSPSSGLRAAGAATRPDDSADWTESCRY